MSDNFFLTFIIPHREAESFEMAAGAAKKACCEAGSACEIIAISGNNPTKQRNLCIDMAKSDYIYFIDNDSVVVPEALKKLQQTLTYCAQIAAIGGPAIAPRSDSFLQKNINSVLTSPIAVGKIASRYSRRGDIRETDDSELILCNLAIKKSIFDELGKFNENLYPNEENEFLHKLKSSGKKVIYDPDIYVFRSQRETLKGFIRQFFTYGRGRGEQTRISPESFKKIMLLPVAFALYVLFIAILGVLKAIDIYNMPGSLYLIFAAPSILYFLAAIISWTYQCWRSKYFYLYHPALFFLNHFMYGAGFIYGYFRRTFESDKEQFYFKITKIESNN